MTPAPRPSPPRAGNPPARPSRGSAAPPPGLAKRILLDITGVNFLVQMKKLLGGPGFALALGALLAFMFFTGARIERYAHLGEHQYVLSILPLASCFSPLLALLMALAFALGDVLTNATYWLFPDSPVLNLFKLFKQPAPLLTWGAYARMGFLSLPIYALFPGIGSKALYAVASHLFQAGRAKLVKDGGKGDVAQLQAQLSQATQVQGQLAAQQQGLAQQFQQADTRTQAAAEQVRDLEGQAQEARARTEFCNAQTQQANAATNQARQEMDHARAQAHQQEDAATRWGQQRAQADHQLADVDARLRLASGEVDTLKDKQGALAQDAARLKTEVGDQQRNLEDLAEQQRRLYQAAQTGVGPDGRPLSPEQIAQVRQRYLDNQAAYADANEQLSRSLERQRELDQQQAALQHQLAAKERESQQLLERYRQTQAQVDQAKAAEEAAQAAASKARVQAEEAEARVEAARQSVAETQRQAQLSKERFEQASREKVAATQAMQQSLAQRNQLAQQLNQTTHQLAQADQKVGELRQALGLPPQDPRPQPAGLQQAAPQPVRAVPAAPQPVPQEASPGRHKSRPDPYQDAIRQWDQAMYADMERRRQERETWIRDLQDRYKGSLPSGVAGTDVAGTGNLAGMGLGGIAAAAVGAAAGTALGGAVLHGHMYGEYMVLRPILHPSGQSDPGCYKMDVNYLDSNILDGTATSAAGGPVSVVTAGGGEGGIPPTDGSAPPNLPPEDPGAYTAQGSTSPTGTQAPTFNTDAERDAWERAQKAKAEADAMRKQWQDSEATADTSDPNYAKNKQQYDDYINYKDKEAAAAEGEFNGLKAEADAKAAAEAQAKADKEQWIQSRQDDLKAAAEEKAHLEAVMAGAAAAGFNTSEHQVRLDQLNQRLGELHGQLGKEGADISYTARDRGVIAPGKEFVEMPEKQRQQDALFDKLKKMEKAALDHGMAEPGMDGKGADVHGKVKNLINDFLDGKKIDMDQVNRIRDHIGKRMDGTLGDPNRVPPPEKPWYTDFGAAASSVAETGRNIGTCTTSDGKLSWMGLGGRVGIGLLTLGQSEWVFQPLGAGYTMKDAVDKGHDGLSAFGEAVKETIKQEIGGRIIGGIFKTGVGAFKGMAQAEMAGENILKGGAKGAWSSMQKMGAEGVKEVLDVGSKEAWKRTGSELIFGKPPEPGVPGSAADDGVQRPGPKEPVPASKEPATAPKEPVAAPKEPGTPPREPGGPAEPGGPGGPGGPKEPPPELTPWQKGKLDQLKKAAESGDPEDVASLYRNGGMQTLQDLQKQGLITGEQMQKVNQVVRQQVNQSVEAGTQQAARDFRDSTGVRVDEVLVGDSGSSAKGSPMRAKTDADRTLIPSFNDDDLARYAHNNNMSKGQAYDELSAKFAEKHNACVGDQLRDRGFAGANESVQNATKNVDYKSYDRIGAASGQTDSYAEGITNKRQVFGTGQKFTANSEGILGDSRPVSGQTVVDQNQINRAKYDPGASLPGEPAVIPPREIPSILHQQTEAIQAHPNDPVTIAKAVGRSDQVAGVVGESVGDSNLQKASAEIYKDPSRTSEVLKKYGFCDAAGNPDPGAFCRQGADAVSGYSQNFPVPPKA